MQRPQKSHQNSPLLAALAALMLAACVPAPGPTPGGEPPSITDLAPDFSKMDWILSEVDGKPAPFSATINLGEPGRISGQAPCNRYFGPVARKSDSFVPGAIAATEMACLHLEGEGEFFAILSGITKAEQGPGMLILSGGGHQMRFVQPID